MNLCVYMTTVCLYSHRNTGLHDCTICLQVYIIVEVLVSMIVLCVYSPAARIGHQLAVIGDDIDRRYEPEFNHMIRMLNLTPETAYEAFAGVARK